MHTAGPRFSWSLVLCADLHRVDVTFDTNFRPMQRKQVNVAALSWAGHGFGIRETTLTSWMMRGADLVALSRTSTGTCEAFKRNTLSAEVWSEAEKGMIGFVAGAEYSCTGKVFCKSYNSSRRQWSKTTCSWIGFPYILTPELLSVSVSSQSRKQILRISQERFLIANVI